MGGGAESAGGGGGVSITAAAAAAGGGAASAGGVGGGGVGATPRGDFARHCVKASCLLRARSIARMRRSGCADLAQMLP